MKVTIIINVNNWNKKDEHCNEKEGRKKGIEKKEKKE